MPDSAKRLTVQEYAAAAGVSVQSVYKQRGKPAAFLAPYFVTEGNKLYILAAALDAREPQPTQEDKPQQEKKTEPRRRNDEIAMLRAQLAEKDKQIAAQQDLLVGLQRSVEQLTTALQSTTESLQAAQALHAGTIQQQLGAPDQTQERRGFFARFFSGKK